MYVNFLQKTKLQTHLVHRGEMKIPTFRPKFHCGLKYYTSIILLKKIKICLCT